MEVYFPPKVAIEALVDGAYFGTSFPEMVFMTRPECRPLWPKIQHVSRIYGFKIHSSGIELQQRYATMKKVRMNPIEQFSLQSSFVPSAWRTSFL